MPLSLTPLDRARAERMAASDLDVLSGAPNAADVAEVVRDAARAHALLYAKTGAAVPWLGYLALDETGSAIGVCGFKDACRDGLVEIAYFTFPAFERQGWGRRMAAALVDIAFRQREVGRVLAHTLPARNASTRILQRIGFRLIGPIDDSEDGTVWRWALSRPRRDPT